MVESNLEAKGGRLTEPAVDHDFEGEDWEPHPLAGLDAILEASKLDEEGKEKLAFEFNLRRTAASLLQVATTSDGRPAQLVIPNQSGMTGFVKDGCFHIYDTFTTGPTYRDLTGEGPGYAPIPLERIEANAEKGHVLYELA